MKNKFSIILLYAMILLSGCSRQNGDLIESSVYTEPNYPQSYFIQTDKVIIDCVLEVPNKFTGSNFHIPKVVGIQYYNTNKAYKEFVEGKIITEQHDEPPADDDIQPNTYYIMSDDSLVGIGSYLNYYRQESAKYRTVVRSTEQMAPQENFSFATGDSCMYQVKKILKEIDYPTNEFSFSWFSTSGKDYQILEQKAFEDGAIGKEDLNSDGWTEKDNTYEIYAWQTYEGLPVFPQKMTTLMSRAIESYQKAPISAVYNKNGLLSLMAESPYQFEKNEEITNFKPFEEIVSVLMGKYENLLNDQIYSVKRAKLALRVYFNEKQQYQAEPVWYFEVYDNNSNMEIAMFNAATGEEIYLS